MSPTLDLRKKYGGNSRQALARAIRAECVCGSEILRGEVLAFRAIQAIRGGESEQDLAARWRNYTLAHGARVECENVVRERYGMPARSSCELPPIPSPNRAGPR